MKSLVLLLLSLTLISCNKKHQDIDPEFQSDFDSFISEAKQRGRMVYNTEQISIKRGSVEGKNGNCHQDLVNGFSKVEITIDSDFYYNHWLIRRALVFHELGHCLLYKKHNEGFGSDGFPISIMHPNIPGFIALEQNWVQYVDELMSYSP